MARTFIQFVIYLLIYLGFETADMSERLKKAENDERKERPVLPDDRELLDRM